jgi:hypothetical protein
MSYIEVLRYHVREAIIRLLMLSAKRHVIAGARRLQWLERLSNGGDSRSA